MFPILCTHTQILYIYYIHRRRGVTNYCYIPTGHAVVFKVARRQYLYYIIITIILLGF